MTVYLDASVLVSLFVDGANTALARRLDERHSLIVISPWTLMECSSAFARLMRMKRLSVLEKDALDQALDFWAGGSSRVLPITAADFQMGRTFVQASRAGLRSSDALHLAVAAREALQLATFDTVLTRAAAEFGIQIADVAAL